MTDRPDVTVLARGWLWMRLHGATPAEAISLATHLPDHDPKATDAVKVLVAYRLEMIAELAREAESPPQRGDGR